MTSVLDVDILRHKLYQVVERCQGNLLDPQVIEASQKLDKALLWQMAKPQPSQPRRLIRFRRNFTPMDRAAAE